MVAAGKLVARMAKRYTLDGYRLAAEEKPNHAVTLRWRARALAAQLGVEVPAWAAIARTAKPADAPKAAAKRPKRAAPTKRAPSLPVPSPPAYVRTTAPPLHAGERRYDEQLFEQMRAEALQRRPLLSRPPERALSREKAA